MKRNPNAITLLELLVVIGIFAVLMALLLPVLSRARERANRTQCGSNLSQIGKAILLYTNDERNGAYPRTGYAPGASDATAVTWGTVPNGPGVTNPFVPATAVADNDVSAAFFLLLRTQNIPAAQFVCPSSGAWLWDFGGGANTASNWNNWEGVQGIRDHLSYSYQNPYLSNGARQRFSYRGNSVNPEFAVASDMNPGPTAAGSGVLTTPLTIATTSPSAQMKGGNSTNHNQEGQNVLFGDGHVEFVANPFVGVGRDNIFTARSASNTVSNRGAKLGPRGTDMSPWDDNDSILLPHDE